MDHVNRSLLMSLKAMMDQAAATAAASGSGGGFGGGFGGGGGAAWLPPGMSMAGVLEDELSSEEGDVEE